MLTAIYLSEMSLVQYNPDSRLVHLSTEAKLICALGITIGILFCKSTILQLILAGILVIITIQAGLSISDIFKFFKYGLPVILIIFVLHLFYHDGNSLFRIWFLKATDNGLKSGLSNTLRFINFGLVAVIAIASISPVEFSRKLAWGLGLIKSRSLSDIALVFFIAIRFFPSLAQEIGGVKLAMIARGADFKGGLFKRIKLNLKLLLPLFSRVIRQADDVAAAITLKGFQGQYLAGVRPSFCAMDIVVSVLAIAFSVILVIL